MSCAEEGHASWSRECPTFVKKLNDLNDRTPENALQYIPTADPWMWTASVKPAHPSQDRPQPPLARPADRREQSQQLRRNQLPPRKYDTYIPNYDKTGIRMQERDRDVPRDLNAFQPLNRQYLNSVNNKNPNRPNPAPTGPAPTS